MIYFLKRTTHAMLDRNALQRKQHKIWQYKYKHELKTVRTHTFKYKTM